MMCLTSDKVGTRAWHYDSTKRTHNLPGVGNAGETFWTLDLEDNLGLAHRCGEEGISNMTDVRKWRGCK